MPSYLAYRGEEGAQWGGDFGVNKAKKWCRIIDLIQKWPGNKANLTRAFGPLRR